MKIMTAADKTVDTVVVIIGTMSSSVMVYLPGAGPVTAWITASAKVYDVKVRSVEGSGTNSAMSEIGPICRNLGSRRFWNLFGRKAKRTSRW